MKSQIGQWGNSLGIRIPKYAVEALALKANAVIEVVVEDGKLVLTPVAEELPELTLEELLAQVQEVPESEVNWGQSVGNETW